MSNDAVGLESQLDTAIGTADPVVRNLRITVVHHELSTALSAFTGAESGANFHTWAVWGSKKAGKTIRREDIPHLELLVAPLGAVAGALAARPLTRSIGAGAIAATGGAAVAAGVARWFLAGAARRILTGNVTVLDDIGRATARFLAAFGDDSGPDPERLSAFLSTLRPGPTATGGQDLLRLAFTQYYSARHAPDADARDEHMLFANYTAILHEHVRLQPYISEAMPGPLRRLITGQLLGFALADYEHDVSEDVEAWSGTAYPDTLAQLANADLASFLAGWDRTPDDLTGSRADDWSDILDRMNFIVDLFRSRHHDAGLFTEPYTAAQRQDIAAGSRPDTHL